MADMNASAKIKTIRLNLHKLLNARKMSLKDLQRATGCDYSALHDQAHGKTARVEFATLAKIKKALKCEWDELFKAA